MKRPFQKGATTYEQQVALLQQRGMIVDDVNQARFYLQHVNYYRLGAYWLPFEADHAAHRFEPDTGFAEVLGLYTFDRELRLLLLDAIERLEVSVRSQWAYQIAHRHGAHGHLDPSLALRPEHWRRNLSSLTEEVDRSHETFIRHFRNQYVERLPPVWAACEVMSLGQLSRWYANLKPMQTRRAIAEVYALDQRVLESWLHHLTHVRNFCAHHSRLWNREFTITPVLPRKPASLEGQFVLDSRKLYNSLVILLYFMDLIAPRHHWRGRVKTLLAKYDVDVSQMGFPRGWNRLHIWRDRDVIGGASGAADVCERLPDSRVRRLSLKHVQAYAEARGWQGGQTFRDRFLIFGRGDGSLDQLLVPMNPEVSDFSEMMRRVVQQLAEHEARRPEGVLDDLLLVDGE